MQVYEQTEELTHHGVKGMKWGVRRYQNKDGSLTKAGQKRYERDQRENSGKKKGNKVGAADPHRWVREDTERTKGVVDSTRQLANETRNAGSALTKAQNKRVKRMDLSSMSDKELRDRINREMLERQYDDVFNPKKVRAGREAVMDALDVAAPVLGVASSALAIALSIQKLKGG